MVEQTTDLRVEMTAPQIVTCAHHWQIETPNGETSDACCKLCGATRSFANYSHRRPMTRTVRTPSSEPTARF
ncbi:MAG: hypothetical protein E6I38_00960 [Chloroflexi bacterium]|nr:MAG: hypothetical protein E6I38_00960 [Chloroflexota bacterium]TMG03835.1 MAG: hypothetical protein E6I03_03225 [Chloroflexota bacterium]